MTNKNYQALSWDDTFVSAKRIEELEQYTLLPPGDYDFTVEGYDRKQHQQKPGKTLPSCNKAIVRLRIEHNGERVVVQHHLFLHERMFDRLKEFFGAIGMASDTGLTISWTALTGATGRCRIGHREYKGKTYHECTGFFPAPTAPAPTYAPPQPQPQQQYQAPAPAPVQQPPAYNPMPEEDIPF